MVFGKKKNPNKQRAGCAGSEKQWRAAGGSSRRRRVGRCPRRHSYRADLHGRARRRAGVQQARRDGAWQSRYAPMSIGCTPLPTLAAHHAHLHAPPRCRQRAYGQDRDRDRRRCRDRLRHRHRRFFPQTYVLRSVLCHDSGGALLDNV